MDENALVQRIAELDAILPSLPKEDVFNAAPNGRRNTLAERDRLRAELDNLRTTNAFNDVVANRRVELKRDPAEYWGTLIPPPDYPMEFYTWGNKVTPEMYDNYAKAEQAFIEANKRFLASGGQDPALFEQVQQLKQAADNAYAGV